MREIRLDLAKEAFNTRGFITRKGEYGEKIQVTLYNNGIKVDLTKEAPEITLKGLNSKQEYAESSVSIEGGIAILILEQDWNAVSGTFETAYFEVVGTISGIDSQLSTVDVDWYVLPEADISEGQRASYIKKLEEVLKELQDKADAFLEVLYEGFSESEIRLEQLKEELVNVQSEITSVLEELHAADFYTKPESDAKYVSKSGNETISGNKNFTDIPVFHTTVASGLQATLGTYLHDDTGDAVQRQTLLWANPRLTGQTSNGWSFALSMGANAILGGGESGRALLQAIETAETTPPSLGTVSGGHEHAFLVADSNAYIGTGYQSGGNTGHWVVGKTDGNWEFPKDVRALNFIADGDIPETPVGFGDDFEAYAGQQPIYYKQNGRVYIEGACRPYQIIPKGGGTMFFLPVGCRPSTPRTVLCQGSGTNVWCLTIETDGQVKVLRYRPTNSTSADTEIPVGAWLPFATSFKAVD